jgi:hypothetical protein
MEKETQDAKNETAKTPELAIALNTLEKLILNTSFNKYDMILMVRRWAYELKSKEGEIRSMPELIAISIRDILNSDVDHKMIRDLPHFSKGRKPTKAPASLLDALPKSRKEKSGEDE